MPGNVTIFTANPVGICPSWLIPLWPQLVSLLTANLNGALNVFNYGNSTPAPADQNKPWLRLDAAGRIDKVYNYSGGAWIAKHPVAPGLIQLWQGDISTINTFDGGETAAVSATTGPMWAHVTELQAKFPIGVGTLPGGTILAVGSTGGEENHVLTTSEMPKHLHQVGLGTAADFGSGSGTLRNVHDFEDAHTTRVTDEVGGGQPHNNMPPYYALHFIRKTAREWYRL